MNELEKAYNGIEDAIGSLDYEGNYDVDTPRESLEYIKIYINNLQSKIDKANEIIKDWHQEYNGLMETNNIYIPKDKPSLFDLRDILKEAENVENN